MDEYKTEIIKRIGVFGNSRIAERESKLSGPMIESAIRRIVVFGKSRVAIHFVYILE
jgi:hypothetical protein